MLKASPVAFFGNPRATTAPLLDQVVHRLLAAVGQLAVVLDLQPAVLADVAEVRRDGVHATPAARHLDHYLRCTPDDGGDDAPTDHRRLAARQRVEPWRGRCLDDVVRRVEQSLAPLDQHAVDSLCGGHGRLARGIRGARRAGAAC